MMAQLQRSLLQRVSLSQCDAVNGLSVTETWTLRASLLSYIMALTATIGERAPPVNLQRTLRLHLTTNPKRAMPVTMTATHNGCQCIDNDGVV